MTDVAANLGRVRERIKDAAARVGRDPRGVRIVGVSKTQPVEAIRQAVAAGLTDVGENYVQEAMAKAHELRDPVAWHLIGPLQRNKAARAIELFSMIHTLDSVKLGTLLIQYGERRGRSVRVLIEVNVASESTKSGVAPADAEGLIASLAGQDRLEIDGLMTIPPPALAPEDTRSYFRILRELRDRLRAGAPANAPLRELSMGMSDDFEVAVEEGATIVRIGRAIFGERQIERSKVEGPKSKV